MGRSLVEVLCFGEALEMEWSLAGEACHGKTPDERPAGSWDMAIDVVVQSRGGRSATPEEEQMKRVG